MQKVALELQKVENELQTCVEVRQRLDSQLTENEQVKKVSRRLCMAFSYQKKAAFANVRRFASQEFAILKSDDTVYKLVGPVLLKQEQSEAKTNVDKRIDFIQGEMYVRLCLPSDDDDAGQDVCMKLTRRSPFTVNGSKAN